MHLLDQLGAALMMSNELHIFNVCGPGRNDFSPVALRPGESSSLRQIYLTFPADSTFKEDDVFRYFR